MVNDAGMGRSRILWIDNARAIGIILVIIGHSFRDEMRVISVACDCAYSLIYFFHMPLFFSISGFLLEKSIYKSSSRSSMIVTKIRTLFVPFISYTLLIYFAFKCAALVPGIRDALDAHADGNNRISFFRYLFLSLVGDNPYSFHLWFLISLFIVETIMIVFSCKGNRGGMHSLSGFWCIFGHGVYFPMT